MLRPSYELQPDLLDVDPNGHDPLTSLVLHRGGGGGRVVVVVIAVVVAVDVGSVKLSSLSRLCREDRVPVELAVVFPVSNKERKIMRFNKIYKFSDGTLTNILEELDYKVKEYKVNRLNLGMNARFWTDKDVTRSKEFIHAIERRLKTRRIF
nr:hypothetical protein [Tanacetum cinerariifolium]